MAREFTPTQKDILRIVQADLPDSLTPYADIAREVGTSEEAVLELLRSLKEEGVIRRFGASIKHQRTGWNVNAMVAPSGTPGLVKISTGPLSKDCEKPALVDADTVVAMAKEMGADSLKFFPMGGLKVADELKAVAEACARHDFILEPTGGIDLDNFDQIMKIILDAGVPKVIPHVYSSIIDKATGNTRPEDVAALMDKVKNLI